MNDIDLIALVAETNPYPADGAVPALDVISERVEPSLGAPSLPAVSTWAPRRRLAPVLVAAVAFVAVVLAIGAIRLLATPEPDVVVPLPPIRDPGAAAEAYHAAFLAEDYATYLKLWAPGSLDRGLGRTELSPEKREERFVFNANMSEVVGGPFCEPISELTWECSATRNVYQLERLDVDSLVNVTKRYSIDSKGRLLTTSRGEFDLTPVQFEALDGLENYISATYPELLADVEWIRESLEPIDRPVSDVRAEYDAAVDEYIASVAAG